MVRISAKQIAQGVYVGYGRAYYKPLPYYFVFREEHFAPPYEIQKITNGDLYVKFEEEKTLFELKNDKKGRPYLTPCMNGPYVVHIQRWSGDVHFRPRLYSKVAIFSTLGLSHGGGSGEYWVVLRPENLPDDNDTIEAREALGL
ncbi:hypothetical protein [Caldisericum sp.]|uniref:hypothetical protein n=1 Tax=Caldisericum sp. TaxID=2499687 RepID=UPI003D0CCD1C